MIKVGVKVPGSKHQGHHALRTNTALRPRQGGKLTDHEAKAGGTLTVARRWGLCSLSQGGGAYAHCRKAVGVMLTVARRWGYAHCGKAVGVMLKLIFRVSASGSAMARVRAMIRRQGQGEAHDRGLDEGWMRVMRLMIGRAG